jgi:hypothetical protein
MIYGQYQYYQDELNRWGQIIAFHKDELRETVRQINMLLRQRIISSANEKECDAFTGHFVVQEQQFDHLTNQIISQQQRLERNGPYRGKPVKSPMPQLQNSLRSKMKNAEWSFIRAKYTCSIFLLSFLCDSLFPQR